MMKENWVYRRGDIYMANLNPFRGSEQGGTRPVLVLQNNTGNLFCPTLIVAPLTTQVNKKKDQPTHYLLSGVRGLPEDSVESADFRKIRLHCWSRSRPLISRGL